MAHPKLIRDLQRRGYVVGHTRSGHLRINHPVQPGTVFGPGTPSDHRSWKNLRAQLRRQFNKEDST